ncbi:hypothetical protein PsorP6_007325 [Peronosclerospora sorghi]|uniref:Uncharacterized protein n=1 Tax=Peronosclerospora sorghi TaxID=230839 RepID=A0ACC0WAU5_9STRA|nr:hypothetical protein PsorP6_007325 [Peronosclerospora sorghi]
MTDNAEAEWHILKFQPWHSAPDVSFWQKLSSLKLDTFQLDDQAQPLTGYFTPGRSTHVPARFTLDDSAFAPSSTVDASARSRYEWQAPGILYNTNTLEAFQRLNKTQILQYTSDAILDHVRDDENARAVAIDALNRFVLLTFADLKHHSFSYWFAFPALVPKASYEVRGAPCAVSSILSSTQQREALRGLLALRRVDPATRAVLGPFPPFFVLERLVDDAMRVVDVQTWRRAPQRTDVVETLFGFVDPCPLATHPGWPLRNFLALLTAHCAGARTLRILSFREHVHHLVDAVPETFLTWSKSLVFHVRASQPFLAPARVVGWELNRRGQLGPRSVALGQVLDPLRLAETSVDLNLKLMRWRQVPALDVAMLGRTKCLLLGAGTLGCATARSLLAWGFRHVTFVDHARVSHSNPVRQALFEFQDVGKPKAACAANALQRIYPLVHVQAHDVTIPMAGHALSSDALIEDAEHALKRLEALIEAHDVVFLGTDSRESRWLPTVLCAAKRKVLVNMALGFDSFMVMRHGVRCTTDTPLGCYFCTDVVSPRDSLRDRTLDQMCTVTRPGLAPMAAATAVELLVALLHAPEGKCVRATKPANASKPLEFVPHQVRGFVNAFETVVVEGPAFDKCIACSPTVVSAYMANGFELLARACNCATYLEELTGLSEWVDDADARMVDVDDSDEDRELV